MHETICFMNKLNRKVFIRVLYAVFFSLFTSSFIHDIDNNIVFMYSRFDICLFHRHTYTYIGNTDYHTPISGTIFSNTIQIVTSTPYISLYFEHGTYDPIERYATLCSRLYIKQIARYKYTTHVRLREYAAGLLTFIDFMCV